MRKINRNKLKEKIEARDDNEFVWWCQMSDEYVRALEEGRWYGISRNEKEETKCHFSFKRNGT